MFTLKAWQKISPNTIESQLISKNKQEQKHAEEALQQLGEKQAAEYLHQLLRKERAIKDKIYFSMSLLLIPVGILSIVSVPLMMLRTEYQPIGCGLLVLTFVLGTVSTRIGKRVTPLQRCIAECVLQKPRVQEIAVVLEASLMASDYAKPFHVLNNSLLRQVTPATKDLIPEEFYQKFLNHLQMRVQYKNIDVDPVDPNSIDPDDIVEHERVISLIELFGNTHYEPAFLVLKEFAEADAKVPQYITFKQLAAGYVANWNSVPTNHTPAASKTYNP